MFRVIVQKIDDTVGGTPKVSEVFSQDVETLDVKAVLCAVNNLRPNDPPAPTNS